MLVAQLSPQAVSFPRLPSAPLHPSMSTSPPAQNNSTSVFNALGSYADRIKSPTNNGNSLTINGISTAASISGIPSSTMGPTKSETRNEKLAGPQDEGQWETVQVGRHRPRGERRPGGTGSRFGRERPVKEPYAEDSGRRGPEARAGKKATSSSAPPSSTSEKPAISRAPVIPSVGPKSAWGIASPIGQRHQANSVPGLNLSSSAQTPKKSNARPSQTEPSSPSHASTTATNTSASVPASMASPNLSAETASSSTAPTSIALRGNDAEEEGSWRSRSLDKVEEPVDTLVPKQAPPTAVNAWDIKINSLAPAAGVDERTAPPDTAPVLQFGTVTLPLNTHGAVIPDRMTNGDDGVKIAKKKKAVSAPTSAIVAVDEAWPDVAQAAEMVAEGKKEKVKEKKESEESSVADDASVTGKKAKWTAIPATELLAAADEAAEASRRQAAIRKRATKSEASESANKTKARKASVDTRKGVRPSRSGSSEIRLPPMPQNQRGGSEGFKPMFGTFKAESESGISALAGGTDEPREVANGGSSEPLSRQTSRQSRRDSPRRAHTQLPSPSGQGNSLESTASMRFGSGPYASKPVRGNATTPIPQNPFSPNHTFPRPPRASFSGRGRGGYRNSGPMGKNLYANGANMYQQGYGFGYPQFFPPATGYAAGGLYDPAHAQYMHTQMYGRGAPPPPPMPQTVVPNLDPLRFYVLGQVEYYFSMQNLAMDFFLRQQMDSEGWIDIPMIASFNRVKSLTPDTNIIREVLTLSSLLEVRDEKVRLANGESKRWVLPDAKQSTLSPEPPVDEALGIPSGLEGVEPQLQPKYGPGDVENALMKSVPPSSSASLLNGDDSMEKTDTPATSMSGDGKEEEDDKVEVR